MVTGSPFTAAQADEVRAEVLRDAASAFTDRLPASKALDPEAATRDPHPYLGVTEQVRSGRVGLTVARNAMAKGRTRDAGGWHQRQRGRYVLGVVGGSMASAIADGGWRTLATELQASEALQGQQVEVLNLARKAGKQPEQLATLQQWLMLGGRLDGLVNLDGFEELVLAEENVAADLPAWYPGQWNGLIGNAAVVSLRQQVAALQSQRAVLARAWDRWQTWAIVQCYWLWRDRQLVDEVAVRNASIAAGRVQAGAGQRALSPELLRSTRRETARGWRRCSVQMQALCAGLGIDYFHFLQPSQYVPGSKPMSEVEASVALAADGPWSEAVVHGYPLLLEEAVLVRRAGVHFADLSMVLQGDRAPYYSDSYCGLSPKGVEVVAAHMGAFMRRALDMGALDFASVRVEPAEVTIDDPLQGVPLRVLGLDQAGQQHEITDLAFGTTIAALADQRVVVQPGGRVWATQRGRSQVAVRNGDHVIHVPAEANWADAHEGDDGLASAAGVVPRLSALGLPELDGAEQRVRCLDLPEVGLRMLALSAQPIPARLPQDEFARRRIGLQRLPAGGTQAAATVQLPTEEELCNRPLFARVLVLSDNQEVTAASNTLVLTRP